MKENPEIKLIAQYLSGECSPEERNSIEDWINSSADNERTIEFMREIWNSPKVQKHQWDKNRIWENIIRETGIPEKTTGSTKTIPIRRNFFDPRWTKIAAAVFLTVLIPVMYFIFIGVPGEGGYDREWNEITVENGKRTSFTLLDGTKITLDAGSVFRYPAEFADDSREVYLNGEGYFEVASDPEKPFKVHANNALVTVIGTKFNVRAWQPDNKVELIVTEGKVSFGLINTGETGYSEILTEGEMSVLTAAGSITKPVKVETARYLGWMNNDLVMSNVYLSEILGQLERWYDLKFEIDESALSHRITIHLQKESVDNIVELVGALINLNYQRNGNTIRFYND
ncbi:MAG: DUF4974 domain-containing protein [bacterium]|nr:DUF4974 domain-containing protein [bacterium]